MIITLQEACIVHIVDISDNCTSEFAHVVDIKCGIVIVCRH